MIELKIKCATCGGDNEVPAAPVLCRRCKAAVQRDLCDACFAAGEVAGHLSEKLGRIENKKEKHGTP